MPQAQTVYAKAPGQKTISPRIIKKVAFIYVLQTGGNYLVTDDPCYDVLKRPQLGLQYLCAVLEKEGIETNIYDQTVTGFTEDWLIEELKNKGYDMVGFSVSDPQEDTVKELCGKIKEAMDIITVVGGPATLENPSFVEYDCDICIEGEGEVTLKEIVKFLQGEKEIQEVKGIAYLDDEGKIQKTPAQPLIQDLDTIPFPNRSKIDINAYYDWFLFGMKKPYITMTASRGCIYRCNYCTSPNQWGFKQRKRSVDNVLEEIDQVVEEFGVKYIAFQDDIFGITPTWIEEFSTKLLQRPYKVAWMCILHPFTFRTSEEERKRIMTLMKKAGCDTLSFGLQSAHPQILKNINRNPKQPEELKKTLQIAKKLGIVTGVGFIFGLPGDTKETIQTTIDYATRCGATLANFYILEVLRGSDLERLFKAGNLPKCELSSEDITSLTIKASQKFYTRPATVLQISKYIALKPKWLLKSSPNLKSILARIGFTRQRATRELAQALNNEDQF